MNMTTNLATTLDHNNQSQKIVNNAPASNTPNLLGLFIDKPAKEIHKFIHRDKADKTVETYLNHYKHTFMYLCHKSIEDLTWSDIQNITVAQVLDYRDELTKQFSISTTNQRIFAAKALWDNFFEIEKVNKNVFNLKKLRQKRNPYDTLTDKEIQLLYDFCLNEKQKPQTKQLYIEFLYTTGLRKNVAQSIKVSEIEKKTDFKTQQEFWVIVKEDKCTDREVPITNEFYNRLIDNYYNVNKLDGKLFHIDNGTMDDLLERFCKQYGITRHIVQHSIRSASSDLCQSVLNDYKTTADFLGHKNPTTTMNHYAGKNKSYAENPSISLHKGYSIETLKELDKDTLIQLIENYTNRQGRGMVISLGMELDKLNGDKTIQ